MNKAAKSGEEKRRSGLAAKLKTMRSGVKRILPAVCIAIFIIAVFIATEAYMCANRFVISKYAFIAEGIGGNVRIAMLSDLHESEFGKANAKLIAAIKEQAPDIILCVGDMISYNAPEDKLHIGLDLIAELGKIAPVYVSLGNHETRYIDNRGNGLLEMLSNTGAIVLEQEYVDIIIRGESIRIGGISDYCFNYGQTDEEYRRSEKYRFLTDFCDTESYKALMCHRPNAYQLKSELEAYEDWDCDIVLAGHTHGGLWQLPGIGSVYLPSQGFFPKYDKGVFDMGNSQMLVGGGLGNATLFRLFNPCELIVIDITPQ